VREPRVDVVTSQVW